MLFAKCMAFGRQQQDLDHRRRLQERGPWGILCLNNIIKEGYGKRGPWGVQCINNVKEEGHGTRGGWRMPNAEIIS